MLLGGLEAMGHVTSYGKAARRTATAYFTVAGHTPRQVAEHLAARRVNVWDGHNYAWELTGVLAIRDAGSAVRAGLVHYNTREEVERLLAGVAGSADPPRRRAQRSPGRAAATIRPWSRAWRRAASVSGENTRSTPWPASSAEMARTSSWRSGATSRTYTARTRPG